MKQTIWFVSAYIAGGLSAAGLAAATSGDLIYRDQAAAVVTSEQGGCYAACAVADGTWTGVADDMQSMCGSKLEDGTWQVTVAGLKTDTPANVAALVTGETNRVEVVGAVE
jgi:hypothetical protein